jgi:hypothetical protein
MNIKSQVVIEIAKDDLVFSFAMPLGAPFGKAYDAAHEVLMEIVEYSKKAAEQAKQVVAESPAAN